MREKKLFFNQLLRRYNKYRNRFARLAESGKNIRRQNMLEKRIAGMYETLQRLQQFIKLRTAVAATALTMFAFQPAANAQSIKFDAVQTNPFSLSPVGNGGSSAVFADLDGDGDMDMLSGNYGYYAAGNFNYFENTGSNTAPDFSSPMQQNPFGLASLYTGNYNLTKPTFVDLDHDGDFDVMSGNTDGNFYYFENTGTNMAPAFGGVQTNPFSLVGLGGNEYTMPTFVDIDNDGDFDLISGDNNGDFVYFENTGTNLVPVFAAPQTNPFGLASVGGYGFSYPNFYDVDNDGDKDLLSGRSYQNGDFYYFKNTGTNVAPAFAAAQINLFNLTDIGYSAAPNFVDIDNDGYIDLMVGSRYGNFYFFKGICPNPVVSIATSSQVCPNIGNIILTANSDNPNYAWSSNAGSATTNTVSVNSAVNSTYYVTSVYSAPNGTCTTKDSISVYVQPSVTAKYNAIATCPAVNDTISAADFFNDGLVAYYPFNGNANDLSGKGHDANTIGVTPGTDRFGNPTGCYQFTDVTTYVQCPADTYFNGDYTISGWVNVSALGPWARLLDFGNGPGANNVLLALSSGSSNQLDMNNANNTNFTSSQVIDFNTWVQVLFTYNASSGVVICYYNGVAIDQGSLPAPDNVVRNNCYIGLSNWSSDGGVTGSMDDIRIYNRALNATEVSNLYNYEFNAETPQTTYNWSDATTMPYIVASPTVTTTYTVTETGFNTACGTFSVSNTITIANTATASVTASATSTSVCAGYTTTLTGSGANTYTWTNVGVTDGVAITPTITAQYTVTGTAQNGCTDSDTITVKYNPLPNVTFDVNPSLICSTAPSVTLSATPAGGNFTGTGVSSDIFDPSVATTGTYTLSYMYSDNNGCSNTDTAVVTVQICSTGINTMANNNSVTVYPNPSNGVFTISASNVAENTTLVIYNGIGQVVYTQQLNKTVETLNTTLANGVYTLKLQSTQGVSIQRIVIEQ